jgi:hypothetical protein
MGVLVYCCPPPEILAIPINADPTVSNFEEREQGRKNAGEASSTDALDKDPVLTEGSCGKAQVPCPISYDNNRNCSSILCMQHLS